MRRNGYLWTSGVNLDNAVRFPDPDLLVECKISAIWRRFPFIFAFYMLNIRHISTSGLFDLLKHFFCNLRPWFAYSVCNFSGSTMNVIKVISENNAGPCVKRRMSFYACTKSRDLLKVPWMSYCSRSRRRRFTVLGFKSWAVASTAIFSNICTAHAQKRVIMNFRCKLTHHRSIRRTRFPELQVDMTIRCRVIAFLSADTARDLVTLTFWPWTVVLHGGSRGQPCHQVWRPYAYPFLSLELWVITFPIGYHW